MPLPCDLSSKRFSGVSILSSGQGLTVTNCLTGEGILCVNVSKPLVVINSTLKVKNTCIEGSLGFEQQQYVVPETGDTVTILKNTTIVIIDPAGPLATLTINMPASPKEGQIVKINITKDITALTQSGNGNTLLGPFQSAITANATGSWYFRFEDKTWYPVDHPVEASIGDVVGTPPSTDNAVARYDGTTGLLIQNSLVIIDDSGNISSPGDLTILGDIFADNGTFTGCLSFPCLAGPLPTGLGDVVGPASSVDNSVARFDGITGKLLKDGIIMTIDDSGDFDKSGVDFLHERGGVCNLGVGSAALDAVTSGTNNTAVGQSALSAITTSSNSTAVGCSALLVNTAADNTAVGSETMDANISGTQNTAIGRNSLGANIGGSNNTAVGREALSTNTAGDDCTAVGRNALLASTADDNTAVGSESLDANTSGARNTAVGRSALGATTTGDDNIALGNSAGSSLTTTDSDNIDIGNTGTSGDGGEVRIGTSGIHETVNLAGSLALFDEQYTTPLTGTTVLVFNTTSVVIIDPAGTLAALTITMPALPKDGQIVKINITQDITAITHGAGGDTILAPFSNSIAGNGTGTWYFRAVNTTWYPLDVPSDGGASTSPSVAGFVSGMIVADGTADIKTISTGSCRSDDNAKNIVVTSMLIVNITVVGANGIDAGFSVADTWYTVWVINGPTVVTAGLFSASELSPTLPAGYNTKRRVGWARKDSSNDFYDYFTQDSGNSRFYTWRETAATVQVLVGGAAIVFTAVDCSEFIPPTSQRAYINGLHSGNPSDLATFRATGSVLADTALFVHSSNNSPANCVFFQECNTSQSIDYFNSTGSDSTNIWILGFVDNV